MANYGPSGYEVFGIENIPEKYKCIFCKAIIRDPVQLTECGHRSCHNCISRGASPENSGVIQCPVTDCGTFNAREQIRPDKAFKRDLDGLTVTCMFRSEEQCTWIDHLKNYQSHIDQAHSVFICDLCQQSLSSKLELREHKEHSCPTIFQTCILGSACSEEMFRRDQIGEHLLSPTHQEATMKVLLDQTKLDLTIIHQAEMAARTRKIELEVECNKELLTLLPKIGALSGESADLTPRYDQLKSKIQEIEEEIPKIAVVFHEKSALLNKLRENIYLLQKRTEEVSNASYFSDPISTNGTLVWRITGVSDMLLNAQSDRRPSISSPVFFTSPTGYKMQVRLFPFGDGSGRRTHMSMFFLLVKGDYDAILTWPFSYRISFCLLDQTGNDHIYDSFQPDVKSNSFQRPKDPVNVANGIPKFVSLSVIQQDNNKYVREDTMYLKVVVDTAGTLKPNSIIQPTLLSDLPLPLHIQEASFNHDPIRNVLVTNLPTANND